MVTHDAVESFVALLAAAHWESETYDVPGWVSDIANAAFLGTAASVEEESLSSLADRISLLNAVGIRTAFLSMISHIQLVAKCLR